MVVISKARHAFGWLSENIPAFGLFVKLGSKVAPTLLKVLKVVSKGGKVTKVFLAGSSFAAYSYLLTPEFAAVILLSLFIHEHGHLLAMKNLGMEVKGMYFVPLIGAAAVPDEAFETHREEFITAIAGPIAGLLESLLLIGVYLYTGITFIGAVATWVALVNLFNLIPVRPLDGGRMLTSTTASISKRATVVFAFLGSLLAFALGLATGVILLIWVAMFAALDLIGHVRGDYLEREGMQPRTAVKAFTMYLLLGVVLAALTFAVPGVPSAGEAMSMLAG